uniref:ORF117 n=2 Tax=Xanthomonas TaxID=338 RepID=Q5D0L2_XANCA|nr:ORF117 [Xanthomonas campestris]
MASETLGWWLGAAPGFVIALRTWWQGLRLQSRLSAAAVAERKWAAAELSNHQKVNLWFAPHRFISPDDTPSIMEAKKPFLRSDPAPCGASGAEASWLSWAVSLGRSLRAGWRESVA